MVYIDQKYIPWFIIEGTFFRDSHHKISTQNNYDWSFEYIARFVLNGLPETYWNDFDHPPNFFGLTFKFFFLSIRKLLSTEDQSMSKTMYSKEQQGLDSNSPCVKQCHYNPELQICSSCKRTIQEIRDWSKMSEKQRLSVLHRIRKFDWFIVFSKMWAHLFS